MVSVVLVVFDGLRPDMIRPETTPNLVRFAAMGARMPHARSVFPSETRVCSASVSTGCYPRRHGLVANEMFHPADHQRRVSTGNGDHLRAMEQELGQAAIQMPGLSDILSAAGRDFSVFSSGSTGQTFILAPRADQHGQVVVSAHGPQSTSIAGQAVLARLTPPPQEPAARAVWIADAWRITQLPSPPAASVLWLCEPDTSAHYTGLDSDAQRAILHQVDAAFGRILDDWQAGPQRDELQIIVASDHGHITIDGRIDLRRAFGDETLLAGCELAHRAIAVPGGDRERIVEISELLMRQDWIGHVFSADAAEMAPGALPRSAVMGDHARAGHVLFTLRNSAALGPTGLPGLTLIDDGSNLPLGGGMHGGLNAGELSTVLMLAGSGVRAGVVSDWPAGLVDIAPTILALLDVPGASAMDGRVLGETLEKFAEPTASRSPETWEASGEFYAQRVARVRVGTHVWIDHGARV